MKRLIAALTASFCLFVAAGETGAGEAYIVTTADQFGLLNLQTGTYTSIGTTRVQLDDITIHNGGTLYGIDQSSDLQTINKSTAQPLASSAMPGMASLETNLLRTDSCTATRSRVCTR